MCLVHHLNQCICLYVFVNVLNIIEHDLFSHKGQKWTETFVEHIRTFYDICVRHQNRPSWFPFVSTHDKVNSVP